jgi:FAS-associated factor 2
MSLLAYPFHFLAAIIRFLFQTLRIPIPNVSISLSSLSFSSLFSGIRAPVLDPYTEADRWVRSLEEETGATCISKASSFFTNVPLKEGDGEAGSSSSVMRNRHGPMGGGLGAGKVLPDFWLGSYEEALRACQQQLRIGCAILVSAEHDDTLTFKRCVLRPCTSICLLTWTLG